MRNLLAVFLLSASLAAPVQAQSVDGVAAVVNDEIISTWDVRQRMRLILISLGVQPDQELLRRVQAQALNGGPADLEMPVMRGIERSAEQADAAATQLRRSKKGCRRSIGLRARVAQIAGPVWA